MTSWMELAGSVDYRALSDSVLLGLTSGSIDLLVFLSERVENRMTLLNHLETLTSHYPFSTIAKRAYIIRLKTMRRRFVREYCQNIIRI